MGFKVPKQTITLQFTDEDYAGLEIETKMPTVRDAMAGEKLQKEAEGKSEVTQMTLLFEFLMQFITKWNLEEEDGTPIPLSKEVLLDFPAAFAWDIFHAFFAGASGVDDELGKDSDSTVTFPEGSINMEML